jgi:ribose-phosphate pyrophosphokinase
MYTGSGIIKIFAGETGRSFAKKIALIMGTQLGDATTIRFSEGNIFVRVNESIRGQGRLHRPADRPYAPER